MRLLKNLCLLLLLCLMPACATPQSTPLRLRVLTYNIHHGAGTDGQIDLQRLADIINRAEPDLVALQEVDAQTQRSGGVDQADRLAELTGMHRYFAQAMPYQGGGYGNAILARSPDHVVHGETIPLPSAAGDEPRAVAIAEMPAWGGHRPILVFAGTHLCHKSSATRRSQVDLINQQMLSQPYMLGILAGDFNFTPDSPAYRAMIDAGWVDAAAAFGDPAPTVPADNPSQRIDYVFILPAERWRVIETRVLDEPIASDHRPLLVVLEYIYP